MKSLIASILLASAACSSSSSVVPNVAAPDFIPNINPKTITQTVVFFDHPENNVTKTNTLIYENNLVKEIDFVDSDGPSGYIKVSHDEVGNVVKSETFFTTPGTNLKDFYLEFHYSNGLLVGMKKYFSDNGSFMLLENTMFVYNINKQLTNMKITGSNGQTKREYTYGYSDNTTNPSTVRGTISDTGASFSNGYNYEQTASPLTVFFQVLGLIDQALIKNNVKSIISMSNSNASSQAGSYTYAYNGAQLPTKYIKTSSSGTETWEVMY